MVMGGAFGKKKSLVTRYIIYISIQTVRRLKICWNYLYVA